MVYGRLFKNNDDSFVIRILMQSEGVCIIPVLIFTSASLSVSVDPLFLNGEPLIHYVCSKILTMYWFHSEMIKFENLLLFNCGIGVIFIVCMLLKL
jgi:hypothetical protein